jgi:hypothetical protein
MPRITLARTPREKFALFMLIYTARFDEPVKDMEILSAFLDCEPNLPMEDVREIVRMLAMVPSDDVRETVCFVLDPLKPGEKP